MGLKRKVDLQWKEQAKVSLKNIYYFIKKDSPQSAKKVKKEILALAKTLIKFPEKYSKELYYVSNDGSIRYVPIYSYKIIYQITSTEIIILDIFHTSRNPEEISKYKHGH
jgi:plasmid stabilization system protein ParE